MLFLFVFARSFFGFFNLFFVFGRIVGFCGIIGFYRFIEFGFGFFFAPIFCKFLAFFIYIFVIFVVGFIFANFLIGSIARDIFIGNFFIRRVFFAFGLNGRFFAFGLCGRFFAFGFCRRFFVGKFFINRGFFEDDFAFFGCENE